MGGGYIAFTFFSIFFLLVHRHLFPGVLRGILVYIFTFQSAQIQLGAKKPSRPSQQKGGLPYFFFSSFSFLPRKLAPPKKPDPKLSKPLLHIPSFRLGEIAGEITMLKLFHQKAPFAQGIHGPFHSRETASYERTS